MDMSFAEIPSKIIERSESLVETKMTIACEFTKLVYTNKQPNSESMILETFERFYHDLVTILPQSALETMPVTKPKLSLYFFLLGLMVLIICSVIYYVLKIP